jgi:hypothetical protein
MTGRYRSRSGEPNPAVYLDVRLAEDRAGDICLLTKSDGMIREVVRFK